MLKRCTAFLLAVRLATASAPTAYDCSDDVTYTGTYRSGVEAFLSIPYAQDTGGEHRFKPPRPYVSIRGTEISATVAGPTCPQQKGAPFAPLFLQNATDVSEDCLHLNIERPNGTHSYSKLPVMVFIHGGSFIVGSKDEPVSQPPGLILQSVANGLPVLVVEINYRLGVFGFAKSTALTDEGSANAGIKDQRLALEWVKEHIESFGGDSDRITIFGQSSGGLAVGLQILAYGAEKWVPFQQAIAESQILEPQLTGNVTDRAMNRLVDAVGCSSTDVNTSTTISCLRDLSLEDLLSAQTATHKDGPGANIGDEWMPIVDGDIIPDAPSTLIAKGRFANITTMVGWCEDDTAPFTPTTIQTDNDTYNFLRDYAPDMSPENVQKLMSLYPVSDFSANPSANLSAQFYRSARILRDILMVCEPQYYGRALASKENPVYMYDQNQTMLQGPLEATGSVGLGVVHTSEFAYVFGNLSTYDVNGYPFQPRVEDYAFVKRESRSWSTFAATGRPSLDRYNHPSRETLDGWCPAFAEGSDMAGIFVIGGPFEGFSAAESSPAEAVVAAQKLEERCAFINSPEVIEQLRW
ncbi:hypothetical protein KC340_g7584 [Hortaea werneckii]|nr:hypothetical protein KC342_g7818 [Hortaea werneckii]KAI7108294.1 hypothetical protein KC339_g1657 [Hortaea werneckii]KAI7227403.1 hypothetical protein KC365_g8928 [Hortaea werneckii]KAI7320555.1 hypothetical protein KC340_g7584 [Hortaea werneckii]KAI7379535.1 hypothetical protein KC328_g13279 [Hortaea werneckii]